MASSTSTDTVGKTSRMAAMLRRLLGPRPLRWAAWLSAAKPTWRRKRLSDGTVKEYPAWRLTIPIHAAEQLGLDPGTGDEMLLVLAARLRWWHLLDHDEEAWNQLPEETRAEICLARLRKDCPETSYAVILGTPEELKQLGLEPGETIHAKKLLQAHVRHDPESNLKTI